MKEKLIIIAGPTGVGKSHIALKVAQQINAEIISCDSMQIYKGFDIGTAKVTAEEFKIVPHHMIDIVNPDESFSVEHFMTKTQEIIHQLNIEGKLPILVGGTGLYINSIIYNLNLSRIPPQPELRNKYETIVKEHGKNYLHQLLKKVDLPSYDRFHENDVQRIIRALEVYDVTGVPISSGRDSIRKPNNRYNYRYYGLTMTRSELYARIEERVDRMLDHGLVAEVEGLLACGMTPGAQSMQAIGYKEVIPYIHGECSYDEMVYALKQNSRRYGKRQWTWFNRSDEIQWFDRSVDSEETIVNRILNDIMINFKGNL